jgi:DNA-binding transcriptional MerR regulator
MNLVSIGEFSRLSRLSAKALRLYDELGLLVPAHVDAETGYRRCALTQRDHARLVASLRRAEVPLARIGDILTLGPASAAEEIRARWADAEAEHAARRVLAGFPIWPCARSPPTRKRSSARRRPVGGPQGPRSRSR